MYSVNYIRGSGSRGGVCVNGVCGISRGKNKSLCCVVMSLLCCDVFVVLCSLHNIN